MKTKIHFQTHGTGRRSLVFLHGWGGSSETWNDTIKQLDLTHYRAIGIDLRGHGHSPAQDGFTWETFAEDVLGVVDAENIRRFIPVGFSLGGKLALFLAAKYPHRIAAQILVAPAGPGIVPVPRVTALEICREAGHLENAKRIFKNWFAPSTPEKTLDFCCQTIVRTNRYVLEATAEMALWISLASPMPRLHLSTLLVTGDHDPVYHAAYQREHVLPFLSELKILSLNSGHFIPCERPKELAEAVSDYLRNLPAV